MSFHEPERRSEEIDYEAAANAGCTVILMLLVALFGMGGVIYGLMSENARLTKELNWWTCREQTEIKPVSSSGSPTLREE